MRRQTAQKGKGAIFGRPANAFTPHFYHQMPEPKTRRNSGRQIAVGNWRYSTSTAARGSPRHRVVDLDVALGGGQVAMTGQRHDHLRGIAAVGQGGYEPPPTAVAGGDPARFCILYFCGNSET